jgi:hypothetical protein
VLGAPGEQVVVDELASVVRVDTEQGERQDGRYLDHRLVHPPLSLVAQRADLGPAGGHVGQGQGLTELAPGLTPIVPHQIDLEEAGAGLVPLGEGADRDLAAKQRSGLGTAPAPDLQAAAVRSQQSVDRRSGDPQELVPDPRIHTQLPGALHRFDRLGHERRKAFARRGIERRPDQTQRPEHILAVGARAGRSPPRTGVPRCMAQGLSGVIATPPRERAELVQDLALLLLRSAPVPRDYLPGNGLPLSQGEPLHAR